MMCELDTLAEDWTPHSRLYPISADMSNVPDVIADGKLDGPWAKRVPHYGTLVHSGGVGIAFVLLTELLGIKPSKPGFSECILTPQLDAIDNAKGMFPLDKGHISVSWQKSNSSIVLHVRLPASVNGKVRLPEAYAERIVKNSEKINVSPSTAFGAVDVVLSPGENKLEINAMQHVK